MSRRGQKRNRSKLLKKKFELARANNHNDCIDDLVSSKVVPNSDKVPNEQLSNDLGEKCSLSRQNSSLYHILLSITTKLIDGSLLSDEEISFFEHLWVNDLYHSSGRPLPDPEPEKILLDEPDRGAEGNVRPQGEAPDHRHQQQPHQNNGYRTWRDENHRGFTR